MRKVVYGGAVSLDGMLAGTDGALDWLIMDAEAMELMAGMWDRFDVMLMGRKTWEFAMASQEASTTPSPETGATPPNQGGEPEEETNPYVDMKTYVFSRTMAAGRHESGAEIVNEPVEFVRELKSQTGKDICVMGGGEIGSLLLDAGLVDEVGFNIHPLVLGAGVPALPGGARRVELELVECRAMKSGCVYVLYRVRN